MVLNWSVICLFFCVPLGLAQQISNPSRSHARREDGNLFNITFYHINDIHAHLDQFSSSEGTFCHKSTKDCVGGYARIKNAIDSIRPSDENSLFLNAGDEFQGTMFYTYYKGEKISEVMNQMGYDAFTLGNHDFDGGLDTLGDFVDNLTFPVLSANIQFTDSRLNASIKPYHIFEQYNLAVIGVTTTNTPNISDTGSGTEFLDPIEAVQQTIDYLKANTDINRFAALTHVGYSGDVKLAEQTSGLHLIMGGHTHTLLGDMSNAKGKYPTIVQNKDGEDVLVTQAFRWGEYLGQINVQYDENGRIVKYNGAPIHMEFSLKQESDMEKQIQEWEKPFADVSSSIIGESMVKLNSKPCQTAECGLGNLMADAMLSYCKQISDATSFALFESAIIKTNIGKGEISQAAIYKAFPTAVDVVEIPITGDELWKSIEGLVSGTSQYDGTKIPTFFQVSHNVQVDYNPSEPIGSRLYAVRIDGKDLDRSAQYNMATVDILAGGGNNIFIAEDNYESLNSQADVLIDYVRAQSPVNPSIEGRIRQVDTRGTPTGPSSRASLHAPLSVGHALAMVGLGIACTVYFGF